MSLAIDWFGKRNGEDPMAYLDDVFRYAALRLGQREDAEDVAIEVVQALPNPCSKSNLRVDMLGMSRRKVADRLRMARPTAEIRESDVPVSFDNAADEAAMVGIAMQTLSPDHREVLILKYVVGLSSAEIGQVVGKKTEAIDSMLQRARSAFEQTWLQITSEEVKQ